MQHCLPANAVFQCKMGVCAWVSNSYLYLRTELNVFPHRLYSFVTHVEQLATLFSDTGQLLSVENTDKTECTLQRQILFSPVGGARGVSSRGALGPTLETYWAPQGQPPYPQVWWAPCPVRPSLQLSVKEWALFSFAYFLEAQLIFKDFKGWTISLCLFGRSIYLLNQLTKGRIWIHIHHIQSEI